LVKESKIAEQWQKIVESWQNLVDLEQPMKEAEKEMKKLNDDAEAVKNITHLQGNMLKGVVGMIEKDDETGAAIVGGMGTAFNFLMDQTVNNEVKFN
jgi:hypothetical protein